VGVPSQQETVSDCEGQMRLSLVVSLGPTDFDAVAIRGGVAALDHVKALGYDGVEIAVRDPSEVDAEKLLGQCMRLALPVVAIGTGQAFLRDGLSVSSADEGVRSRAIERLRGHIALAEILNGCPGAPSSGVLVIIGLIRGRAAEAGQEADGYLRAALDVCLKVAERAGVGLVIEPINRYETDWLNTVGETIRLIERVGHPRLGVLADTFHMNIEERSIEGAMEAGKSHLRHVHVADSNRWAPGDGHLDFGSILQTLRRVKYGGYLSAEILPRPDEETAARRALSYLREIQKG
jgi:sugar phosphate isomerase/epimerase